MNLDALIFPIVRISDECNVNVVVLTAGKQSEVADYYKKQERLLVEYTEMEAMSEIGFAPESLTEVGCSAKNFHIFLVIFYGIWELFNAFFFFGGGGGYLQQDFIEMKRGETQVHGNIFIKKILLINILLMLVSKVKHHQV